MSALICTIFAMGVCATGAAAAGTGGVSAAEPTSAPSTATKSKVHLFPVTSRSSNIAYKGPVYEKTSSGVVIPFVNSASTTTGTEATATGGAPVTTTADEPLTETIPGELTTGDGMTSAKGPTPRPELLVPGATARFVDGLAAAPEGAPAAVQEIIWAGNEVIGLPYIYGGGHGSFVSPGYDCSGTVSYALHGAALLTSPEDSSEFEHWGSHGAGRWIAIFANPEHAYMTVAGLRLDTSPANDPSNLEGPRWRPLRPGNPGFKVRHPLGL